MNKKFLTALLSLAMVLSLAFAISANANQNSTGTNATSTKGQINAQQHRSAVANFVQMLLKVATSTATSGIGQQVRVIAQQQNDSDTTTTAAIEKINNRNKIQTFLFGSDYRNLGALRSEVVHTRNRIAQLNRLLGDNATSTNASDTAALQSELQKLELEQTKIDNFIKTQETKFSLFGWLLKMFNRY